MRKGELPAVTSGPSHPYGRENEGADHLNDTDILIRLRQLQSGYSYFMSVGLSYTFGSIFNNVVNPRFGRND